MTRFTGNLLIPDIWTNLEEAQTGKLLRRIFRQNLRRVIHAIYELRVGLSFVKKEKY